MQLIKNILMVLLGYLSWRWKDHFQFHSLWWCMWGANIWNFCNPFTLQSLKYSQTCLEVNYTSRIINKAIMFLFSRMKNFFKVVTTMFSIAFVWMEMIFSFILSIWYDCIVIFEPMEKLLNWHVDLLGNSHWTSWLCLCWLS
jgi:hypothetical protein